jgi:DNA invertase Pin-like site-specific DNA recombinase
MSVLPIVNCVKQNNQLFRWSRSTLNLIYTLQDLSHCGVSLIAPTGIKFDLDTPQGKLIASIRVAAEIRAKWDTL